MKKLIPHLVTLIIAQCTVADSFAQSVAINADGSEANASAILDIKSINKGLLMPRMTTAQRNAIAAPAKGLIVFDNTTGGFWFHDGTGWNALPVGNSNNFWSLGGNAGINPANNYIGTSDAQPLRFRVNGGWAGEIHPANVNTFLGIDAGQANTTGTNNTAFGYQSLYLNNIGKNNTAIGTQALASNTTASESTAIGGGSLFNQFFNNGGSNWISGNTAVGFGTLHFNNPTSVSDGINNTAVGHSALYSNTSGYFNTAIGQGALFSNTLGSGNTAIGYHALFSNVGSLFFGHNNTAVGENALISNTSGLANTASGMDAIYSNTTGSSNTGMGYRSLYLNNSGFNNVAIGWQALFTNVSGSNNTMVGLRADNDANSLSNNTIIGSGAHSVANNTVVIGYNSFTNTPNLALLGNPNTAYCGGYVGWTTYLSDGRFKKNVQENVGGLAFISQLRPVTYTVDIVGLNKFQGTDEYRKKINKSHQENGKMSSMQEEESDTQFKKSVEEKERIVYSGFIAQEVEEAAQKTHYNFSGLKKPQNEKDNYGLTYSDFVVPLVKAVQEQQAIITQLQQQVSLLEKKLTALDTKQ